MNRNVIKKIAIVLLILMIGVAFFTPNMVNATEIDIEVEEPSNGMSDLSSTVGRLLGFLQVASGLMAVLMIAFTGFNYIVATPEVKEEMKKKMVPIIIGIVLVFGAVSIGNFLLGLVQ